MDWVQFCKEHNVMSVKNAIAILAPELATAHGYKPGEHPHDIRDKEIAYLRRKIISLVDLGRVEGELKFDYLEDVPDRELAFIDDIVQVDFLYDETEPLIMNTGFSTVHICWLIPELANDMKTNGLNVPKRFKAFPRKKLKGVKVASSPDIADRMTELAKLRHSARNAAKNRIRAFIDKELARIDGDMSCTCMHIQLTRYIMKQAKKGRSEVSLSYGENKSLKEEHVRELVKEKIDAERVWDTSKPLVRCEIHGLNN